MSRGICKMARVLRWIGPWALQVRLKPCNQWLKTEKAMDDHGALEQAWNIRSEMDPEIWKSNFNED